MPRSQIDPAGNDEEQGWEWLEAVLRAIDQPVIAINGSDRSIALFNAAAERQLGYSAAEVTGQNVAMLMVSPQREEHDGTWERGSSRRGA